MPFKKVAFITGIRPKVPRQFIRSASRIVNRFGANLLKTSHGSRSARLEFGDALLFGSRFSLEGEKNTIQISDRVKAGRLRVIMKGGHNALVIREGVRVTGKLTLWLDAGSTIVIDSDASIESGHFAATEGTSLVVGEGSMIATDVEIRTGDSHSVTSAGVRINAAASVHIGERVWIGARATVLKGVSLMPGTVVGAGSVVTKSFPAGVALGGNPARVIREQVSWDRARI